MKNCTFTVAPVNSRSERMKTWSFTNGFNLSGENAIRIQAENVTGGALEPIEFRADKFGFFDGNVGIGTTSPASLLNVRGYTGGVVGSQVDGYDKNLVIGGAYNQTYNSGNAVLLHIADYSNDVGDDVYPIYVESENNDVDFYINSGTSGSAGTAYFGGSVGIGAL